MTPPVANVSQVRFLIQDIVSARALFTDEEIAYQISRYAQPVAAPQINLCAADLCFLLASKFYQQVTRSKYLVKFLKVYFFIRQ